MSMFINTMKTFQLLMSKWIFASLAIYLLLTSTRTVTAIEGSDYESNVAPLLDKFCFRCHAEETQENDLRIDNLDRDFLKGHDFETWHDILDSINRGEMPPEDETQPTDQQRQVITQWITDKMTHAAKIKRATGGQGVLRRLTRYEYNNTMSDLLGVELDYAADLPPESNSRDGFMNNGSAMGMSGMQMEYYLRAAQLGLSKALVEGPQPKMIEHVGIVNVGRRPGRAPKKPHTRNIQPGNCFMTRLMDFPIEGPVTVRIKAHSVIPDSKGPPRMRVMIGIRADTYMPGGQIGHDVDVVETSDEPGVYEFTGRLENYPMLAHGSNFRGLLVNVHNVYDDGSDAIELLDLKIPQQEKKLDKPDPKQPWLVVESVEFVAPDYQVWPPKHHRAILFNGANIPEDETGYVRQVLERFMMRAYRRPATEHEVDVLVNFYHRIRPKYSTFVQAMQQTLSMVLVSPQFLYLMEPIDQQEGAQKLTAYEVASRLSYFLWSTMPDEELFSLAASGQLLEPKVLRGQIKRMINAPRADRFVVQFSDQWLDLPALDRVAVNPQFYPDFNERLKPAMRQETQLFFAEILHHKLSALNLIDSDFTMLNERLAKHYGIDGVTGTGFSKVNLKPKHRRGGLLTQASMLVGNSTGEDSHPIDRAVWILERLLDDPPSPPPANVPALDSETPGFSKLTLKGQLAVHREHKACATCHLKIDPWGIPLENYDAIGLYRTEALRLSADKKGQPRKKASKAPLDAADTMPDGQVIDGAQQLKDYILTEKKDMFSRAIVVKLLSYALGRSLEFTDEPEVERLSQQFAQQGYRLDRLITSIVLSELFLTR